jgi:hypothetical protein
VAAFQSAPTCTATRRSTCLDVRVPPSTPATTPKVTCLPGTRRSSRCLGTRAPAPGPCRAARRAVVCRGQTPCSPPLASCRRVAPLHAHWPIKAAVPPLARAPSSTAAIAATTSSSSLRLLLAPSNHPRSSPRARSSSSTRALPCITSLLAGLHATASGAAWRRPRRHWQPPPFSGHKSVVGEPLYYSPPFPGQTLARPRWNLGRTAASQPQGPNCRAPFLCRGLGAN